MTNPLIIPKLISFCLRQTAQAAFVPDVLIKLATNNYTRGTVIRLQKLCERRVQRAPDSATSWPKCVTRMTKDQQVSTQKEIVLGWHSFAVGRWRVGVVSKVACQPS